MSRRNSFIGLFVVLFGVGCILASNPLGFGYSSSDNPPISILSEFNAIGIAYAQDEDPSGQPQPTTQPEDQDPNVAVGSAANPWDLEITTDEVSAYRSAITETNCATPSLECLVRNTSRFLAIEWTQEILGGDMAFTFDDGTGTQVEISSGGGGVLGGSVRLLSSLYGYQPATTSRYVAYVLDSADMAPPAYAQGIGFAALDPVLNLWKMFRNIAYFFFIAVFIIIGFMIMFRQKISGQAAITAQQAIPSIIISLILVTFSYAIAGFMIDIMYLIMYMMVFLFSSMKTDSPLISAAAVQWSIFELGGNLMSSIAAGNFESNVNLVTTMVDSMTGMGEGNPIGGTIGFLGGLTLSIVLAIAVLMGVIKLFFELLKSYAIIIMSVIFSPFYLMMGAFPGKNTFMPWFKNLAANLAAFPTVLLFVMMYAIFTDEIGFSGSGGFMPPYLIGSGQSNVAGYLLGLAIVLALPEIVKEIKKRMGASDGGFGMMIAGAAGGRAKEAWNKGVGGVSGKSITNAGIFAASSGIGAGTGAIIGGLRSRRMGGTFGAGARTGAMVGAATPVIVRAVPPLAKEGFQIMKSEAGQMVAEESLGRVFDRAQREKGIIGRIGQRGYAQLTRKSNVVQPQNTGTSAPGSNAGRGQA